MAKYSSPSSSSPRGRKSAPATDHRPCGRRRTPSTRLTRAQAYRTGAHQTADLGITSTAASARASLAGARSRFARRWNRWRRARLCAGWSPPSASVVPVDEQPISRPDRLSRRTAPASPLIPAAPSGGLLRSAPAVRSPMTAVSLAALSRPTKPPTGRIQPWVPAAARKAVTFVTSSRKSCDEELVVSSRSASALLGKPNAQSPRS
jgi:hypothetical protein